MLIWQYRLLLWLLAPLLLLHSWRHARREQEPGYVRARLGHGPGGVQGALWLHAASVGEVNAALPLLRALASHRPNQALLLTTTTASGARIARENLPAGVEHRFLPLDFPAAITRFLARHQPTSALIMETELWPNLYRACARRGIPLLIINARLSARTLNRGPWLRALYRKTLAHTTAVLARSENDAAGFRALGARHVEVIGNIKFAAAPEAKALAPIPLGRPYVLAASTRAGEEALILAAWQTLRGQLAQPPLLVIAPRHPQRREAILQALHGEEVALRSRMEQPGQHTTVYLADTFGELPALMNGAECVFVGGSLVAKGGQNLLEPAALGKAVLFGPHMDNFRAEADTLLEAGGAIQVDDPNALAEALKTLLDAPQRAQQLGQRARQAVDARRDMAERYIQAIRRWLEPN